MDASNFMSVSELQDVLKLTEYLSTSQHTNIGIDVILTDGNGDSLGAIRLEDSGSPSSGYAWYPE